MIVSLLPLLLFFLIRVSRFSLLPPNPFNSYVNINIDWKNNETTVLKVFTMSGTEVFSKNIKMNKGTNYVQLNELSTLTSGNYIIQFNSSEGKIFKQVSKL